MPAVLTSSTRQLRTLSYNLSNLCLGLSREDAVEIVRTCLFQKIYRYQQENNARLFDMHLLIRTMLRDNGLLVVFYILIVANEEAVENSSLDQTTILCIILKLTPIQHHCFGLFVARVYQRSKFIRVKGKRY